VSAATPNDTAASLVLPPNPGGDDVYLTRFSRFVRNLSWLQGKIIWLLSFRTGVINAEALDMPADTRSPAHTSATSNHF